MNADHLITLPTFVLGKICNKCGTVLDRDHNAARNILAQGFKLLAEYLNSTVGHTESDLKRVKAQGETDLWLKSGDALALSRLNELRTKNSWESPAIPPRG